MAGVGLAGDELRPFAAGAFAAARGLDVDVVPVGRGRGSDRPRIPGPAGAAVTSRESSTDQQISMDAEDHRGEYAA